MFKILLLLVIALGPQMTEQKVMVSDASYDSMPSCEAARVKAQVKLEAKFAGQGVVAHTKCISKLELDVLTGKTNPA